MCRGLFELVRGKIVDFGVIDRKLRVEIMGRSLVFKGERVVD